MEDTIPSKPKLKSYRDLLVWQRGMELVAECYKISEALPKHEMYAPGSRLRRSVVSIPSNIAEGHSRYHTREFLQHLNVAYASLAEVETLLEIALRLQYVSPEPVETLLNQTGELGRMLNGLIRSLRRTDE